MAPLLLVSNLATEQNFAAGQGNQLIADTLPAAARIQGGIGASESSPAACVQICLSAKKKKKIIPTLKKKKKAQRANNSNIQTKQEL